MNHYITHLAIANEIQPVVARKDILAKTGEVLVGAGERINHQTKRILQKNPLAIPIEFSVRLDEEFTATTIYQLLIDYIDKDPALREVFQLKDLRECLRGCVDAFAFYDILRQKLNVLAIQLPSIFDQSLFSAWMAVCVHAEEGYPQFQCNNAFIAAICHDFGLLEISPHILFKEGALSAEDWKAMQQHPVLGAELLQHFPGIEAGCVRAVLEHHESIDGTGYPHGKFEKKLCDLGRLLHTLDSTNAIYQKHFRHQGRTLHDLLPVLQMTSLSRQDHFSETLSKIIKQTSKTEHTTIDENLVPAVVRLTKDNAAEITHFIEICSGFTRNVGSKHGDIKVLTVQNIAHLIKTTLSRCGIINEAYMRWLDQVQAEKLQFAYRELEDVLLMTEEIKFHIIRCKRQIALYVADNQHSHLHTAMQDLKNQIEVIPRAIVDPELQIYLKGRPL